MENLLIRTLIVIFALVNVNCITTTHHDKPEKARVTIMASTMKENENGLKAAKSLNVTLSPSERQKRLLPYMTFYLAHDFNRPQDQINYQSGEGQRYPLQKATTYQQFHNKFSEQISPLNPNEQKIKYTPFLESNALPGPFLPMRNTGSGYNNRNIFNNSPPQIDVSKVPNYSAIYEKLSQLKLQNQLKLNYQQYTNKYNNVQLQKPQSQDVAYIPVRETYKNVPNNDNNYEQIQVPVQIITPNQMQTIINKLPELNIPKQIPLENENVYKINNNKHHIYRPVIYVQQKPEYRQKPVYIIRKPIVQKPFKYDTVVENYESPKYQSKYNLIPVNIPETPRESPVKYINSEPPVKYINTINSEGPVKFINSEVPVKYSNENSPVKYANPDPVRYTNPDPVNYDNNVKYINSDPSVKYVNSDSSAKYVNSDTPVKYLNLESPIKYVSAEAPIKVVKIGNKRPNYIPIKYEKPIRYEYSPKVEYQAPLTPPPVQEEPQLQVIQNDNSLSSILKKLQDMNALPHTITPDNIDNSIRTLVKILSGLKKQTKLKPIVVAEEEGDEENEAGVNLGERPGSASHYPENTPEGGTPGKPGVDYPALSSIPETEFNCKTQRYKGFFGDPETHCQVWHYCDLNGGQASFLCPNGTIFSQVALTCDWWYNVKCANTPQLYVLNERLYKYILPLSPKFPEDYSGPLVDKYLALKFKEMEEKMRQERNKNKNNSSKEEKDDDDDEENESENEDEANLTSSASVETGEIPLLEEVNS